MATRNKGKLLEFINILGSDFELLSLEEVSLVPNEVEETGKTFEENSCIKAVAYGDASGILTIADDTGLVVDSLNGRPGVYSARYAPTSQKRIEKLLVEMKDIPESERSARFISVVCLYDPKIRVCMIGKGKAEGKIMFQPKGSNGFGYDSIFFSNEIGKTFGEATDQEKNKISHRARSLKELKTKINS